MIMNDDMAKRDNVGILVQNCDLLLVWAAKL